MKVGDYVRTDTLGIWKLEFVRKNAKKYTHHLIKQYNDFTIFRNVEEKRIVKSSPNIIDLIEVGDYVNGFKVLYKGTDIDDYGNDYQEVQVEKEGFINYYLKEKDIKSILTKEQFESMEYKIGEWLYACHRFIK